MRSVIKVLRSAAGWVAVAPLMLFALVVGVPAIKVWLWVSKRVEAVRKG